VGHVPAEVMVLKFGTLPRTSSGKIRRSDAVVRYMAGTMTGVDASPGASRRTDLADVADR